MEKAGKIFEGASRIDEIYDEDTGFGDQVRPFVGGEEPGYEEDGYAIWKYGHDSFKVYYYSKEANPLAMGQTKRPLSEIRKYYNPRSNVVPFRESEYIEVVDVSGERLDEFGSVLFYEILKILQDLLEEIDRR